MKTIVGILTAAILAGCATSFDTLDKALPQLTGRNISFAADYLGIPDQEYTIAGRKVYVWNSSMNNPFVRPVTTTTTGTVGTTPFSAVSTGYVQDNSPMSCKIRMITDNEIIQRIEYDGNNGACMKYSERLKPLLGNSK